VRVLLRVPKAYETQRFAMLLRAFNEVGFLAGLDKLYAESEQALEAAVTGEDL
jgi:hypothetical protein